MKLGLSVASKRAAGAVFDLRGVSAMGSHLLVLSGWQGSSSFVMLPPVFRGGWSCAPGRYVFFQMPCLIEIVYTYPMDFLIIYY